MKGRVLAAVVGVGVMVAASASSPAAAAPTAAERERARTLMDEGDRLVEQQKYDQALTSFQAAHGIMHVPTTGIEVAHTLTNLGRLIEAREVALEVTRLPVAASEPKLFAEARKDAQELADRLNAKIPTLRFELPTGVEPEGVHVWVDGEEIATRSLSLPKRLNPGKHAVRADRKDHHPFAKELELREAAREIVTIEFASLSEPAPATGVTPASSSLRSTRFLQASDDDEILGLPSLAFYGIAGAAAGFTLGTITGLLSLNRADEAERRCGPDKSACDPAAEEYIDSSKTLGWVSTLSFTAAIAGGALATYVLVKPVKDKSSVRVSVGGPNLVVRGSF